MTVNACELEPAPGAEVLASLLRAAERLAA